jgi:hypothetical protein
MFRAFLRHALALAVPAVGVALASSAQANVRTVMPGAACQVPNSNPTGDEPGTNYGYFQDGSIQIYTPSNPDFIGHNVPCPMTRNLPLSTAGLSDLEVRFRATPNHQSGLRWANCEAKSLRSDGTIIIMKEKSVDIPPSRNVNGIDVADMVTMDFNAAINASASKGSYMLYCYMPTSVALVSYYHSENDGIDGN